MTRENTKLIDPIEAISSGYRDAQILFTAVRVGIFTALFDQALSCETLCASLDCSQRGMRILCDALVTLGLLDKEGDFYCNSAVALEYLLPDSPKSKAAMMNHGSRLYERWGKLYDVVKTGKPVSDEELDQRIESNDRAFAKAMADVGRISAQQTADIIDIRDARRMLDIGGGPGLYSIAFVQHNPALHATVFDSAKTLEVAQENIDDAGLSERVSTKPGNAFDDDFGGQYDFILISNFIHIFSYDANQGLIKKCADALAPGGRICLKDFFLEEDRTSPEWSAIFAVNMLVSTEEGDSYTINEAKQWLDNAGMEYESLHEVASNSRIIMGKKSS
jgi:3-hydroxy-5-methyl-1-naphthoate 3-O-methyltransferase